MMGKREAVRAILSGQKADRIPVIMNACSMPPVRYGYSMPECLMDPNKFCEAFVGTRRALGYDGIMAGIYTVAGAVAGHLPNETGNMSFTGEETITCREDLKKLAPFDPEKDPMFQNCLRAIDLIRAEEPDEPLFLIVQHPTSVAFAMMGAKRAFKAMIKDKEFFIEATKAVEQASFEAYKILGQKDIDFLWFPTPNFGGFCISKKTYEQCIYESHVRFMKMMDEVPMKRVLHTCGLYDDRLDLVLDEHGDAWHIADTTTKKIKEQFGDKVALMGCIPSVRGMLEMSTDELYKFAYQECLDGAYDGRFILSADCDIPPATSDENMKICVQAARDAEKVLNLDK